MPRYCFNLQVRPDRLDEYVERHRAVWPEMQAALRDTGWHNYSLFLRDDGLLIGYVEADDLDGGAAGDGGDRGEHPLAGRDERVLRRASTAGRRTSRFLLLREIFHLTDHEMRIA